MIAYLPSIYPDELLYSLFARYYVKSGYISYINAAEDLYMSKTTRPNIEFINELNENTIDILTQNMPFSSVVLHHTMFAYYGRFISAERQNKAFSAMLNMNKNYNNYLYIPKHQYGKRYLRYCPLCVREDRQKYGETYWHRKHQIMNVDICPIHFCKLHNSSVEITSKASPSLISAEESAIDESVVFSKNETECKIAKYVYDTFISDMDMKTNINIGDYLYSRLENTKYLSLRGEQRNITLLFNDFKNYYKDLPNISIQEDWQLQKIFNNKRCNLYEICLLAVFLNVGVNELVNMKLPKKKQKDIFDEKVLSLHKQGLKYPEIAKRLNASYDVVKAIGEGKYGYYHYCVDNPKKGGAKKKDWKTFDETTIPLVINVIDKINAESKPQKITIGTVERLIGIPKKSLCNCPLCLAEIEKHIISQEEFYAKKVVWAVKQILADNKALNLTNISRLTNMRKYHFKSCVPYIKKYANQKTVAKIVVLIDNT